MITCQLEQLPGGQQELLTKWFNQAPFNTFLKVAEAKVKEFQTKALQDAVAAAPDNSKIDIANLNLRQAQRWQDVIDLVKNLAQERKHSTAKLI